MSCSMGGNCCVGAPPGPRRGQTTTTATGCGKREDFLAMPGNVNKSDSSSLEALLVGDETRDLTTNEAIVAKSSTSLGGNHSVCVSPPASSYDCWSMKTPEFSSFETCDGDGFSYFETSDVVSLLVDNEFPDLTTKTIDAANAQEVEEKKNATEPMADKQISAFAVADKIAAKPLVVAEPTNVDLASNEVVGKKASKQATTKKKLESTRQKSVAKAAKSLPKPVLRSGKKEITKEDNKAPTRPRRPLSAYNLFFKYERTRLLRISERGEPFADVPRPIACMSEIKNLLVNNPYHVDHTKRPHRKSHGKFGFSDLFKTVLKNWQQLTPQMRAPFDEVAAGLKASYEKEAKGYKVWKRREQWRKTKARSRKKQQKAGKKFAKGDASKSSGKTSNAQQKQCVRQANKSISKTSSALVESRLSAVPYPVISTSNDTLRAEYMNDEAFAKETFHPSMFDEEAFVHLSTESPEWKSQELHDSLMLRICEEDVAMMM